MSVIGFVVVRVDFVHAVDEDGKIGYVA